MDMIKRNKMHVPPSYDRYNIIKKPNYKEVKNFFISKELTKKLSKFHIAPPQKLGQDIKERNVTTTCYNVREELQKVENKLLATRAWAQNERRDLNTKWKNLIKGNEDFKNNFINFNNFVEENEAKRSRASQKVKVKSNVALNISKDIEKLNADLQSLEEIKELMDKDIDNLQVYKKFLSDVVSAYPKQFTSVNNVIERFEALLDARKDLQELQLQNFDQLEKLQKAFETVTAEKFIKIVGLNTQLAELHKRYEIARTNCIKWEIIHNYITLSSTRKLSETVVIKDTCWRIYEEMCTRKNLPLTHKNNVGKQLQFIKGMLYQYECINKLIKEAEEEKEILSEKAVASTIIK